jgi:AAA15 family ATPase/GTPase
MEKKKFNNSEKMKNIPVKEETNTDIENIKILGQTLTGAIILLVSGEVIEIKLQELTRDRWIALTGKIPKKWNDIKTHIILKAYEQGFIKSETIGQGIWNGYIVNGKQIIRWNGEVINEPKIDGKIVELNENSWVNFEGAKSDLPDAFQRLYDIVKQWNWVYPEMAKYITAFMMLSPFQKLMKWRPIVYITGRRGAGKTTFLDALADLWGGLIKRLDKATAYSIAQSVGNTGKIAILDEFENDKHIDDILNMMKNASGEHGGTITRGTTARNAKQYKLHHLFWLASIYVGGKDAAILSRMAKFEMLPPKEKTLSLPTQIEWQELRRDIVRSMIDKWNEIEKVANEYRKTKGNYNVQDGRLIDNYAYAAAVVDLAGFEGGIPEYLSMQNFQEDEENILEAILTSKIRYINDFGQTEATISEALKEDAKAVEDNGVKLINGKELAINVPIVQRYLLRDTIYRNLNIKEPLLRIAGAEMRAVRFGELVMKCVVIPFNDDVTDSYK